MAKKILFNPQASEKLLEGAKILHDAVSTTLGPRGLNVGIDRQYEKVIIHDGVKVAREVDVEDEAQNFAISTLRQTANKQIESVGDGTTVSIILAYSIYKEAMKQIAAGTNAMSLKKGLEEGRSKLLTQLKKHAIPLKTKEQAVQIATISAEDEKLGKQIGELIHSVGIEGVVTVEETNMNDTYIERQEGMQFDKGYISPAFITDPERMEATLENTRVLLTDKSVNNVNELLPLLEQLNQAKQPILTVIAPDISGTALASMILTKMKGGMLLLCVQAPYAGQQLKDFLDDIALLTGGVVVSDEAGRTFQNVSMEELGKAERITSTQDATLIVRGKGDPKAIKARIKSLKTLQERNEGSDYQKEKLRERIGKLTNGIAVVYVGGATEVEKKEKLERADDAVHATQAALQEGIVAGGEIIYLAIRRILNKQDPAENILYNALEKPFAKLLQNAGMKSDAYLRDITETVGIDVITGKSIDMIKEGIIDPSLVASEAITNAVSTAIQLMSTDCLILPIKEEKK